MTTVEDDNEGLRRRNTSAQIASDQDARNTVLQLNASEEQKAKNEKDKKTFGRTPNGTVFTVPYTHDMVTQLLSPSEPKNTTNVIVLLILASHVLLCWALPQSIRVPTFATLFLFWRAAYNFGIGYLLHMQSNHNMLVRWARKSKVFSDPGSDSNPHPRLRAFLKHELEVKIPKDYSFDAAPIEYNTWLVFRGVVDLILMCDFVSYVLFAIACGGRPVSEFMITTVGRWTFGLVLFAFNLWVKLDAHRVVKDFAWYWGDFFFLVDQELTFDGVFEMAPHPMYSIGYVGYYGISLMAASYKVLFISIIAHAAQFAFLVLVETPHIERTYSSPPPRRQFEEAVQPVEPSASSRTDNTLRRSISFGQQPSTTHNLLGFNNLDFYRTTDSSVFVLQYFIVALTILTPTTRWHQAFFVFNAILWRIWYSVGLGYLLNRQSSKKKWTRHYLKYGESTGEAWRQWKGTYHLSMTLCYLSFAAAAWKMYALPSDWDYGLALLKHVVGGSLIVLQVWVAISIYDQLGEFGWFYGDFFFDQQTQLTYGGIYRFLNNPERVLGLAGVWGVALMTSSKVIFILALFSHTLSLAFIQFVERPHMQKLYGRNLRQDAGLVRSLRRSLPPPFRQWQDGMDKMLEETLDFVEEFLDAARPKLAAGVHHIVQDTKDLFHKYPTRISIRRLDPDVVGFDQKDYSLEILGTPAFDPTVTQHHDNKDAPGVHPPLRKNEHRILQLQYGAPITIKWTAPLNHSKMDWVGLYLVSDNSSREVTQVGSHGRWTATNLGEYDTLSPEIGIVASDVKSTRKRSDGTEAEYVTGEVVFSGDKLWWIQGVFEFRYHHNGRYNVMTISEPFEVRIPRFSEDDLELSSSLSTQNEALIRSAIEKTLLPVVQNCFDRDPEIAPATPQEAFGGLVEREGKFATRVVYAIQQIFGIDFAPAVVKADGKVENLAWRIWEAKKVLAPYSMSRSRGLNTPVNEKEY